MFHPLTRDDLPEIWRRQQKLNTLSSEFDAFRLYAWLPLDRSAVAFWRDQFVLRCRAQGEIWYIAPPETEDFHSLLDALAAYERAQGGTQLRFLNAGRPMEDFPSRFTATPRRDLYDYLYQAQDLIGLRGRAYQARRNQISQFKRAYDWRFEPLCAGNRDACLAITDRWDAAHEGVMVGYERTAIERMVTLDQAYGQSGGILFADGEPAAFAIGSHPRPALLDIVAEKALPAYTGAYAMIIQAYAVHAHELAPFEYINREEDMGLENLRNAKQQLKPVRLLEKTLMTEAL